MNPDNPSLFYYRGPGAETSNQIVETDLCIYGGTSGGVVAAVQMRRMGYSVALVEFGRHLGGMTSSGLGATDIGNKAAVGGISREFYRRLGAHYGTAESWTFEPHVAENLFETMIAEAGVPVFRHHRLKSVVKSGNRIEEIEMDNGARFRARMFIDATYEGDFLAAAGVGYHVGRESNATYGETLNGIHFGHPQHNFEFPVDPYVVAGQPASGLLQGISDEPHGAQGDCDRRIQAYNFRVCLSDDPANRKPYPRPVGYDPARYELLRRYIEAGMWDVWGLNIRMPGRKSDHNNWGGFASDNIGRNYAWPQGDYATREAIFQDHVTYQQGLFYFLANDGGVPANIREAVSEWGLPLDEFPETRGWPHQLYVREARRMLADCVMTEHHCQGRQTEEDSIGLAAYTIDSHNCRRVVVDGYARNEGNVEVPPAAPFPISYRALVPREEECGNLLVPFCLSASHTAFGSIRMEPVLMVLGQSCATAAAIALDAKRPVQRVDYAELQQQLLKDGQILQWS